MTNKNILVSVLLPVYNGEKYISEAVDSILKQTHENFELIIIDDGSADQTLNILKEYEKNDARIRLVSRENKGLIASLNEGVDLARGEWIARMDADDISMPKRFERQLLWLRETGADIAGSRVKFFGSQDRRLWKGYQSDNAIKVDMLFKCPLVHPSVMMRAELIKQLKYDPISEKAEDYDLWVRASMKGAKIINIPEVLLKYRQHDSQVTVLAKREQLRMTEEIRRTYWNYFTSLRNLDSLELSVNTAFNLCSLTPKAFDVEHATNFFTQLASQVNGEARDSLFDNIYRLSVRNYAIGSIWINLNNNYSSKKVFLKKSGLYLLKLLPTSFRYGIYSYLKTIYFFLMRK